MLGKIEGRSRRGHQRMRWLDSTTNAMEMNLGKLREMVRTGRHGVLQSMGSQRVGPDWVTEQHKKWLYCFVGQRGTQRVHTLNTVCLNPGECDEDFYSNDSRASTLIRTRVCCRACILFASDLLMSFCASPGFQTVTVSPE